MKSITLAAVGLLLPFLSMASSIPVQGYTVVHAFPHDPSAYTEGLFYLDGHLYESTGVVGTSSVRKVDLASGKVLQQAPTPWPDYGEGIVAWKGRLIQLTWQDHEGFLFDLTTLTPRAKFAYPGEGWSLTTDGTHLLMSDGTPTLRILDPDTFRQVGHIDVTADGKPLANLNELEWVKGELYANVWLTDRIARIDPASGRVVGWIDLAGLGPAPDTLADPANDVLNGIAYDAEHDRLFVTGKRWPLLYEIRLAAPEHHGATAGQATRTANDFVPRPSAGPGSSPARTSGHSQVRHGEPDQVQILDAEAPEAMPASGSSPRPRSPGRSARNASS